MEDKVTLLTVLSHLEEERRLLYDSINNVKNNNSLGDMIMASCTGTKVNGSLEGHAAVEFIEHHAYEGNFRSGSMNGYGRYTWKDGLSFKGDFKENHISGQGTYTWPDGSTYTGEVQNGMRNGYGTFYCPKIDMKYIGQWVNGKRHGKGKLLYSTINEESCYDGDWMDDMQTGWGERRYRSGNTYKGQWLANRRHGQGTMYWYKLQEQYYGEWVCGVQEGHGEHIWFKSAVDKSQYPVLNRYVGEWKNGLREGYGTFYYASGAMYIGYWQCNLKHGAGKFVFQNGQVFEGKFVNDKMLGKSKDLLAAIRPQTPLGNLIGEMGSSCTEQFNISIGPLLPPYYDLANELKQLHAVILRNISQLCHIYHAYSSLENLMARPTDRAGEVMTRMHLWQLLKDCEVEHLDTTLYDADIIMASQNSSGDLHNPTTTFLMREFLQALVSLTYNLYKNNPACQSAGVGQLAQCLSYFISSALAINAGNVKGSLHSSPNIASQIQPYCAECWDLFMLLRSTSKIDIYFHQQEPVTLRRVLLLLKDCGIVGEHLTPDVAVHILARSNPSTIDENDYNLELKIVFLEFMESLVLCSKHWYMAKEQESYTQDSSATGKPSNPSQVDKTTMASVEASNLPPATTNLTLNSQEPSSRWKDIAKSFFPMFLSSARKVVTGTEDLLK